MVKAFDLILLFLASFLFDCVFLSNGVASNQPYGAANLCKQSFRVRIAYTKSCGFFYWFKCRRYRYEYRLRDVCCDGWAQNPRSDHTDCPLPICWGNINYCPNEGQCASPNKCVGCADGYYSPRCNECPKIDNCATTACVENPSAYETRRCLGCKHDKGQFGKAYERSLDRKRCDERCSWLTGKNLCFPGYCPGLVHTCKCFPDFSGTDCSKVKTSSALLLGFVKISDKDDNDNVEFNFKNGSPTVYTNLKLKTKESNIFDWNLKAKFQPNMDPQNKGLAGKLPYIKGYSIGIVHMTLKVHFKQGNSEKLIFGLDRSNLDVYTAKQDVTWSQKERKKIPAIQPISSNDSITMHYTMANGGTVTTHFDNNKPRVLTGKEDAYDGKIVFDFDKPYHCSLQRKCSDSPILRIKETFTRKRNITIEWGGWFDDLAGILSYHIEINKLIGQGGQLGKDSGTVTSYNFSANPTTTLYTKQIEISEESPRILQVDMTVLDAVANTDKNKRHVRRFFIYDTTSNVTLEPTKPMQVEREVRTGKWIWLRDLQDTDAGDDVVLSWEGHFANHDHEKGLFLAPVKPDKDIYDSEYEDREGARNMNKIQNAHGVVEFQYRYQLNKIYITSKKWKTLADVTKESVSLNIPREDGDIIEIWIKGIDIMGNNKDDDITIFVDSSPPDLERIGLAVHDRDSIVVHKVKELTEMTLSWVAFDEHSGLNEVHWKLFENSTDKEIVLGQGTRPNQRGNCDEKTNKNCYCTNTTGCYNRLFVFKLAEGLNKHYSSLDHDQDFYLIVTINNTAQLPTTITIKITIDTSAPHPGHVFHGVPEEPDIDYQSDFKLNVHWSGFTDKESGVEFYRYRFGTKCFNTEELGLDRSNVSETTTSSASWRAPRPGQYYVTVVAFNPAHDSSVAVCSSGVTVDVTPPLLGEFLVHGLHMKGGIARETKDKFWSIKSNGLRRPIRNFTQICLDQSHRVPDLSLYRIETHKFNSSLVTYDTTTVCALQSGFGVKKYLTLKDLLDIGWKGSDPESGIADFEVRVSGTVAGDDLLAPEYHTTHQDVKFSKPLFEDGTSFYLHLIATNRAGLKTTKIFGPILVDTTPPVFQGTIEVASDTFFLITRWQRDSFYDAEDKAPLLYEIGVGQSPARDNVFKFTPTNLTNGCSVGLGNRYCQVKLSLHEIGWNLPSRQVYFVCIRVTNGAGLSVVGCSREFVHDPSAPSKGRVVNMVPKDEELEGDGEIVGDVEYQLSSSSYTARWFGFNGAKTYFVCIGLQPLDCSIFPLKDIGNVTRFTASNLDLEVNEKYFFLVSASNENGKTSVSSNGLLILGNDGILPNGTVMDGLPCRVAPESLNDNQGANASCERDIEYQSSIHQVAAHWNLPQNLKHLFTDIYWALGQQSTVNPDYILLKDAAYVLQTSEYLNHKRRYYSIIRFCHERICFKPTQSSGFVVLSEPPDQGRLTISMTNVTDQFVIKFNQPLYGGEYMEKFIWTILDTKDADRQLQPWQELSYKEIDKETTLLYNITSPSLKERCLSVVVRGYNRAGFFTDTKRKLWDCLKTGLVVIDTKAPVTLEKHSYWTKPDIDYSNSSDTLSAVWPSLRYKLYKWAVILLPSGNKVTFTPPKDPSTHSDAIASGLTDNEFINAKGLYLQEARRYIICIHADATVLVFEKFNQSLPELSSCSDGVIVDRSPPLKGRVTILNTRNGFQTSKSDISITWEPFVDAVESGDMVHHSGILFYSYSIGTFAGEGDVKDQVNVGVTNHTIASGLKLQPEREYYITVRATDNVGLFTESEATVFVVTSGPQKSDELIRVGTGFITSREELRIGWEEVFKTVLCDVQYYSYGLGSGPGRSDILPYERTVGQSATLTRSVLERVHEGHAYYATIKAMNLAGLETSATSHGIVVDFTPPVPGHVINIDPNVSTSTNAFFKADTKALYTKWEPFTDSETSILEYFYMVGTCNTCGDLLPRINIGIRTEFAVTHLDLRVGKEYFTTVEACNAAGLCSSTVSPPIVLDNTPPISGLVEDGIRREDLQFTSSRSEVSAKWFGFNDPQSRLAYYEWWAGTTPGQDDVITKEKLHLTPEARTTLTGKLLPAGETIYITVRAYNYAGLWSEATSNGFLVDVTPPVVKRNVEVDESLGCIVPGTSIMSDTVKVVWSVEDPESHILYHQLSIESHENGRMALKPFKIFGSFKEWIFTNLTLKDGGVYIIQVRSCNNADLCAHHNTSFLIDTTPPSTGTLASQTAHAANLGRHLPEWMVWAEKEVKLAWLGFLDQHSGMDHYEMEIGSTFFTQDLLEEKVVLIPHMNEGVNYKHEGIIQTANITLTRDLQDWQDIFITLWGVNKVGLPSHPITLNLKASKAGSLDLVRRCEAKTCYGHCACAPLHSVCTKAPQCNQLKLMFNPNWLIKIVDTLDLRPQASFMDTEFFQTKSIITARWNITRKLGKPIIRYECSIGYAKYDEPKGIFDTVTHRVWFDAINRSMCIFNMSNTDILSGNDGQIRYKTFVRAWYDSNTYTLFNSSGFQINTKPPQINRLRFAAVKEVRSINQSLDIDFIVRDDQVTVTWKKVFIDNEGLIKNYKVCIGSYRGGTDILCKIYPNSLTTTTLTGLKLEPGVKYYTSVVACFKMGLCSEDASDGFLVDLVRPTRGYVRDGYGHDEADYQSTGKYVSARWNGFLDKESFIKAYHWCVGNTPDPHECNLQPPLNTKLKHYMSKVRINSRVPNGSTIYHKVWAQDQANWSSDIAVSDGVTVDETPPLSISKLHLGHNIILNPSFEDEEVNALVASTKWLPKRWRIHDNSDAKVIYNESRHVAHNGVVFLSLRGSISQDIFPLKDEKYRLSFFTSHVNLLNRTLNSLEIKVSVDDTQQMFLIPPRVRRKDTGQNVIDDPDSSWYEHVLYFTATKEETLLTFTTLDIHGDVGLDDVSLRKVQHDMENGTLPAPRRFKSPIRVDAITGQVSASIHASWDIEDPESSIKEFMWAIGTVRGGSQLLPFTSLGPVSSARAINLHLQHNITVHVTIVAVNRAGLRAAFNSDPVLVDRTPPLFRFVWDGDSYKGDLNYQLPSEPISVQFEVSDPESGMHFCEWCLGRAALACDILPFTRLPHNTFSGSHDLNKNITFKGATIYSTVQCVNKAGLRTRRSSDGVKIYDATPDASAAHLTTVIESPSCFPQQRNTQTSTDKILLNWSGFSDHVGITHFELMVRDNQNRSLWNTTEWHKVARYGGDESLNLTGLPLQSGMPYLCAVRAVNWLGKKSKEVETSVTVDVNPPSISNAKAKWVPSKHVIRVTWTASSTYRYHISVGRKLGHADIMLNRVTHKSMVDVSGVDLSNNYYLVMRVVTDAGVATTYTYTIACGSSDCQL